jgi:ABC-2 type transport system permease protein
MLIKVASFEFRYLLRNPLLWLASTASFALLFIGMSVDGFDLGNEGGLLKNAAYATLRNYVVLSVFFMFVTTAFVANAVLRDDETGFGPIIRSTGITKYEYVVGRFLGAFAIAAVCMLLVPLAILVGPLMPWAPAEQVGPGRMADHLYGYFLVALPNLFIHGALLFALATTTRSMMAAYLAVVSLVAGFFTLQTGFVGNVLVAIGEPFGGRALKDAVRYWTVAERNTNLPELTGAFLYNRLFWVAIAAVCIALACALFRFADQRMSGRDRKRLKLADTPVAPAFAQLSPLPSPTHGTTALRALFWLRTRFEMKQVLLSAALGVLMAWGLLTSVYALSSRDSYARPTYPTTLTLIPSIQEAFSVVLIVVAIFFAGELVWRERDRRVHEIIDATPLPNWAYVVPKTVAMALVLVTILLVNVAAAVIFQLSSGHTNIELDKYLLWYVLPGTWDVLLLAVLAVFIQSLSVHKTIGWGVMVAFIVWQLSNKAIDHNLLNYGTSPAMPLSDMNGAGSFWQGAWVVRAYWGAVALLLLVGAHLLWRRGTEIRLRPRLALARRRLTGGAGRVAAAALMVLLLTGTYAYYNINILNDYRSPAGKLARTAALEKKYWKYHDLPQPTIANISVAIELYPEQRRAITRGHYLLRNTTDRPISDVHVRLVDHELRLTEASIASASLVVDDTQHGYRIYRLDTPMKPGENRILRFATERWHRGFANGAPNTRLIENGTFLAKHELTPAVGGIGLGSLLHDESARRYFGLPPIDGRSKLEDSAGVVRSTVGGDWTFADITLSTSADQTPIAPGRKVSDVIRNDRRIARFVSEAPMRPSFSVQSARYALKYRMHDSIRFEVYYHPAHAWNVDRMLDALGPSLDYYRTSFGPYQFSHLRIVEYPGFANYAQAFAGTIPYSETYGFISDFRSPETIDHVTATTAHELAHQYWAHQVTPADVEGSMVITETLANYSALMMLKRFQPDQFRGALEYMRDMYLGWRGAGSLNEPPLVRVEKETWIGYQKGALAMHLLQERMGEEAVNRALRKLLERYRFKGAPYPRSTDLVQLLRAEARSEEEHELITDLFERVVLYDLKVGEPSAVLRGDNKWEVSVPVSARKYRVENRGAELDTPFTERIEIGLFSAHPSGEGMDGSNLIAMERRPIRSGEQVVKFVTDRRPTHAGIDPYGYYIDRNSSDNVAVLPARQ